MNTFRDDLKKILSINGEMIEHVKTQDEDLCLVAVVSNPLAIRHIRKPSVDVILEAMNGSGSVDMILQIVQSKEAEDVAAVLQDGLNLKNINRKTYRICLEAVRQNPKALKHVPKWIQDEEMIREAVLQDSSMLFVARKDLVTHSLCLEVVRKDPYAVKYVPGRHRKHDIAEIVCGIPELRKYIDPVHRHSM